MTTGIHHVTGITRNVQKNVDFYAGFLGLRLVKRTGGYEDAEQLHLFYGDRLGSPGSLITFLVWEAGATGRVGLGQVSEIAFAIPPVGIGEWMQRAITAQVPIAGLVREFGEAVLRLRDPDGIVVKLVGIEMPAAVPLTDPIAPSRIRGVTVLTEDATATAEFAKRFGYREILREAPFIRMASDTDVIDVRQSAGFVIGGPGAGTFDHVAFRAPDAQAVQRMRLSLRDSESATNVHDRRYFLSLYVREPAGTLFEYATDSPGLALDENPLHLGETLLLPIRDADRADDLRVMLPQFAMPGEERLPARDLPFIHRFHTPEKPDGSVIVLLHGTGGYEADLMPLGHRLNARATLLGVRGRSTEKGMTRWFRRFGPQTYDQADIRAEADAFAVFIDEAVNVYGLDSAQMAFLGYSNGANLLGALLRLHPGVIRRAILLRGVEVLEDPPPVNLAGSRVLLLTGADDPIAASASALVASLTSAGADLEARVIEAGHALSAEDATVAKDWLAAGTLSP